MRKILKTLNGFLIIFFLAGLLTAAFALNFIMLVADPLLHEFYLASINMRISKDAEIKMMHLLPFYIDHLYYWFLSVIAVVIIAAVCISLKNKKLSINFYIALLPFLFCWYLNLEKLPFLRHIPAILPGRIFTRSNADLYLLTNGFIFLLIAAFFFFSLFKINKAINNIQPLASGGQNPF